MNILDKVHKPADLKGLSIEELKKLAEEIRKEIIETVAQTGGHLAPSLGVVELTLALHSTFDSPHDKIIWDVGHQSYAHKIITGRQKRFKTLRQYGGISGFPKRTESDHDVFDTGHSSTSISAALGMALARDLKKENHEVIAVIGDGALTGGMAFEALNQAGHLGTHLIVILNDNEMSIAPNVGALSSYLSRIRTGPLYAKSKEEIEFILRKLPNIGDKVVRIADRVKDSIKYLVVPGVLFEELGFTYLGPIDGHNIAQMKSVLKRASRTRGPVLVHVITKKGKDYKPAELNPDLYHGVGPFEVSTGKFIKKSTAPSYTEIFGKKLVELGHKIDNLVAITAAMPNGTGLNYFAKEFPDRYYDVGIAEQHAVTLGAGLAAAGLKPVVAIYSTFLQRGFDQVLHDVCMQNLPVVLAIDRAGLVGEDGETHQGIFDLSFLRPIPNLTIMAPKDEQELEAMLEFALQLDSPVALRYPRGSGIGDRKVKISPIVEMGRSEILRQGDDVVIFAAGPIVYNCLEVAELLAQEGIQSSVVNIRFIKPLDEELIVNLARKTKVVVTVEEHLLAGGFGSAVLEVLNKAGIMVHTLRIGLPDKFIEHGNANLLRKIYKLDVEGIREKIWDFWSSLHK